MKTMKCGKFYQGLEERSANLSVKGGERAGVG